MSDDSQRRPLELIPRYADQGYRDEEIAERRRWLADRLGLEFEHIGRGSLPGESLRGNIENPIGLAQVPIGLAGPLEVRGEHATGRYYVPLATTEGALVRSYERGMLALTRSGGVTCRLLDDRNRLCPLFECRDLAAATELARALPHRQDEIAVAGEATTRHGKLLAVRGEPLGRWVLATFEWSTGDAHGMNMIARATDAACQWIVEHLAPSRYLLFSGASGEKRPAGSLLLGGKGKTVVAGARVPASVLRMHLRVEAEQLVELWEKTALGHLRAGSVGYNGHLANGLTALFIATGQDVANVVNSSVGVTQIERFDGEDVYVSLHLPSLTVATVGGGTGLGTSRECLQILGCEGQGRAGALAEITAATLLAGELSMAAAIASGEFVEAHETYGRNRPTED